MNFIASIIIMFFLPNLSESTSFKVDGYIDLGPNWNYKYKLEKDNDNKTARIYEDEIKTTTKDDTFKYKFRQHQEYPEPKEKYHVVLQNNNSQETSFENRVTKYYTKKPKHNAANIYDIPHKVKDDVRIRDFTVHLFKQNMKVFDSMKLKMHGAPVLVDDVDNLAKDFKEKFIEFVKNTENQNIKTRIGTQKVILNTIDTSYRILQRLINKLMLGVGKKKLLRNKETNYFRDIVQKEKELEYKHVCKKLGYCRSVHGFSNFLNNFFTILVTTDDEKLKRASDAITEILRYTDTSIVMSDETRKAFDSGIKNLEKAKPRDIRAYFLVLKNVLSYKNYPLSIPSKMNLREVNKTVAFLDIIDYFDTILPEKKVNVMAWSNITNSLSEWAKGSRTDIQVTMQNFVNHVINEGFKKLDARTLKSIKQDLNVITT